MSGRGPAVAAVLDGLRSARKYGDLCPDTLGRIAAWALARHPRPKEALKAAKRKLHQACGAYLESLDLDRIDRALEALPPESDDTALKAACRQILGGHASTAERLPYLDQVYPEIFGRLGSPGSILDVGCGLNPFTLPWMRLPPGTTYRAFDIHGRLVDAVNGFLPRVRSGSRAECRDILSDDAPIRADVVLLLKLLPCLERQQPGAGQAVLERVRAEWAVVSYPNQSLGGADRGMREQYGARVRQLCERAGYRATPVVCPTESFYLLSRR